MARLLVERGDTVTVLAPSTDDELASALPDAAQIVVGDGDYEDLLGRVDLASAACLLALAEDDLDNLRMVAAANEIAPNVPVVLRAFDVALAEQLETGLNVRRSFSASALAAPAFVAAVFSEEVRETLRLGEEEVPLCLVTVSANSPLGRRAPQRESLHPPARGVTHGRSLAPWRRYYSLLPADPLFTIVLTTYNRPSFLRDAVESVLAQTVADFELLVVDDGSTPPAFATEDPRVRVVRLDRNAGLAGARNAGVRAAIGRYVTFLDDDDLYTPDRLSLAVEGLARAPVAICWSRFHDQPVGSTRTLEGKVANTILDGLTPSIGATAIRRDVVPRFDERWAAIEDIDWWLRLAPVLEVTTVREVGHLIRRHDSPRHRNDIATRVAENISLMRERDDYFACHPAAAAFRWKRVGLLARRVGDRQLARTAFARSFRLRPRPLALLHMLRSFGRALPAVRDTPFTRKAS